MEGLEDDPDIAPAEARQRILAKRVKRFAGDGYRAGVGPLQSSHHHQQRGLARARRTDHSDRLAAAYIEVDVLEDVHARRTAAERQVDPAERDRSAVAAG